MKVAIVALGSTARDAQLDGFDSVLALPWDAEHAWRADVLFEMHPLELVLRPEAGRVPDYLERLNACADSSCLFMQRKYEEVPAASVYPLADVALLGADYFGSSPAYMLAWAIRRSESSREDKTERITLFGVDLSKDIYDHQRPNLEYWIGFAVACGITVEIAPGGKLMGLDGTDTIGDIKVKYPKRYGFDPVLLPS
jgi:hypothetical protein